MTYKLYTLDNKFTGASFFFPENFTGIVEFPYGSKSWYSKGKRHRIGGPADICNSGHSMNWLIDDKIVTKEQHDLLYSIMKLRGFM